MMRIVNTLKKLFRPLALITVLSLIFAPVIYYFGEKVKLKGFAPFQAEATRQWTALGLLILGLSLLSFIVIRAIVRKIRSRKKTEKREPTAAELEGEGMDLAFAKAIAVIRSRWSRAGRSIYGVPWFMVIGRNDAGKTSIIENGDMRFPIDHEISAELAELEGLHAQDFVTWRVAGNEAVLLDLDGAHFVAHEDRTLVQQVLWDRFLGNLQKARPRRPLNGIVVDIDLMEFSHFTMAEREEYSTLVRRTVNDLVERLGTRLTVHIAFTKLDQVAGFSDFFESMNGLEREDLFGFHFLYEGRHTPDWLDQFETQYGEFLARLHRQTVKRMLDLKGKKMRREAFTFYRTFLGLEAPLKAFLGGALSPDKFSTPPLVRGIYFASNRQENAPRSVFLEAIGQRYHLPEPLYGTSQGASYPYFITRFFKNAVFPEAGLAGKNIKAEQQYRNRALSVLAASIALCIGGGMYWANQYNKNLHLAENVLERTRVFSGLNQEARQDPTGQQLLEPLNAIQEATFEFENFREISPTEAQLTLYQGRRIGPIADAAYRTILNEQFATILTKGVEERLRNVCPKGSDEELEYLRVYRMLGDLEGRDDRVIDKYFGDLWQASFEASGDIQNQLNGHLDYMLETVPEGYEIDENLVLSTQSNLSRLTPYRRVYSSLRSLAERQLPNPIEFETSIGASFGIVYKDIEIAQGDAENAGEGAVAKPVCGEITEAVFNHSPFQIPRFFTTDEFHGFFVPQNAQVARVSADDLWVLGLLETTNYSEEDFAKIQENVREIYADDYIRTWRQSLNALEPRDFADIRDATEVLRALSGPSDPIRRIAILVGENTEIYEPIPDILNGTEASSSKLPIDPDKAAALEIYESFGEIRRMTEVAQEGGQNNMDQIEEALISLYDYMKSVRDATKPNAKALELAIQRAELAGEDPIYVLNRIAERTPAPFGNHLRHIADESWRVIMVGATEELNRKWHDEIYGDYQRLIAGRYPFRRSSELDLPIEDFEEFFRPGGILERFYEQELLIFVEEATGEPRIIDGQSLAVDADFAANLRQAIDITNSFFDASGELSVEFTVSTGKMSPNLSRSVLNFEGQVVINSHGPAQPITIVWPNIIDGPKASRIDMSPLAGTGRTISQSFEGPWSWLRLYDGAEKSNLTNNSVDIIFGNANGQSTSYRIQPQARVNPFFNSPLSEFNLPSHLRSNIN